MSQIVDVDLGVPEDWVAWRAGAGAEALEAVRGLGGSEDVTRARLEAVQELETILVDEARLAGGVWLPDPTDGPWGQLTATLYAPDDDEEYTPERALEELAKPRREVGSRVFDYSVAQGEAEVGPMVVQVEVRGDAGSGAVRCTLAQTIFPAGGRELVRLVYTTGRPAAFDALARESLTIAAHLTVEREA